MSIVQVIVALGSNLGDRGESIREAFRFLETSFALPGTFRASTLLETEPVDCPPGSPKFLNAVVVFETSLAARQILTQCQHYERQQGRPSIRDLNAPRVVDLDLIAYGAEIISEPDFIVPHPRATQRRFVLQPLVELLPELLLPGGKKTVSLLLHELQN